MTQGRKLSPHAAAVDLMRKKLLQEVAHIDASGSQQQTLALVQKFRELADVGRVSADGKRRQPFLDSQIVEKTREHTRVGFRIHEGGMRRVCALSDAGKSDEEGARGLEWPSPTRGKQSLSAAQPALLVLIVRRGSAVTNLLIILPADPAVERAFQCVGLRSHQVGCPQKRIGSARTKYPAEILLAGAGQDDRVTMSVVFLFRNNRKTEIHKSIMPHVSYEIGASANR